VNVPLVDLHRHVGGSIPMNVIYLICMRYDIPMDMDEMASVMQPGRKTFDSFLKRFDVIRRLPWDTDSIVNMADQVIADIRNEGVSYAELRFSPGRFGKPTVPAACKMFRCIADKCGIGLGLLLSTRYESRDGHELLLRLIDDEAVREQVDGIDFVADESRMDKLLVKRVVSVWQSAGKTVIMHVGESQPCDNIKFAYDIGVRRIAHGIRITEDPQFMSIAAKDCVFYLAPTSNLETGVVSPYGMHPGRLMLDAGCQITIGTDDPSIFQTTLRNEYEIAKKMMMLTDKEVEEIKMNSVKNAIRAVPA